MLARKSSVKLFLFIIYTINMLNVEHERGRFILKNLRAFSPVHAWNSSSTSNYYWGSSTLSLCRYLDPCPYVFKVYMSTMYHYKEINLLFFAILVIWGCNLWFFISPWGIFWMQISPIISEHCQPFANLSIYKALHTHNYNYPNLIQLIFVYSNLSRDQRLIVNRSLIGFEAIDC